MDKEKLLNRITDLEKQQTQLMADINAVNGAIQECQYWITQINQPSEKTE